METQLKLRAAVATTAEVKREMAKATCELKELEQAILAQAFHGELM